MLYSQGNEPSETYPKSVPVLSVPLDRPAVALRSIWLKSAVFALCFLCMAARHWTLEAWAMVIVT